MLPQQGRDHLSCPFERDKFDVHSSGLSKYLKKQMIHISKLRDANHQFVGILFCLFNKFRQILKR